MQLLKNFCRNGTEVKNILSLLGFFFGQLFSSLDLTLSS